MFSNRGNIKSCKLLTSFSYIVVRLIMQVIPMGFIFEDDTIAEPTDTLAEPMSRQPLDNGLLDVDQLLQSV